MNKTNYTKNGKNYYRSSKVVGHKPDGSPIRKEFYGKGIKEAEEKANEYMSKLSNGFNVGYDKQIMINTLKSWLFTIKRVMVKPSTFVTYEGVYRNYLSIAPFSTSIIANIKKIDIQNYYNLLFNQGKSHEKIKSIHKVLHSFFEYAIDEGYIIKNPCDKIAIPNTLNFHEDKFREVFTQDEINYLLKKLNGSKYECIVLTGIYTRNAWRRTVSA